MVKDTEIGPVGLFGVLISLSGTLLQGLADNQLLNFRRKNKFSREKMLQDGLYKFARHPNYTGEMLFWFGIGFIGLDATQFLVEIPYIK